jgi:signal transduction histidine kinase
MRTAGRAEGWGESMRDRIASPLWAAVLLCLVPCASAADPAGTRRVVVFYPTSDGQPGIIRFDQGLRSTLKSSSRETIEVYNEYLDSARFVDEGYQGRLADFLSQKYAGRKIDVVIPALAPSLDFLLRYRDRIFPGVPVIYGAIDGREVEARRLGPGVTGIPMRVDLDSTLDVALRLHPGTRHVAVVAGKAVTDSYWVAEARKAFRGYEGDLEFIYLAGLPMDDLLKVLARLPSRSVIYYLNIMKDGKGETFVPAEVVDRLSEAANAPVYGHFRTYLGHGIVGGRLTSFEAEGEKAARLASRIFAGEKPESIAIPKTSENLSMFDARQLMRWGIPEDALPAGSVVLYKQPSFWDLYRWRIIAIISLCIFEAALIVGLLVERANRKRADESLRESRRELRSLTGRLLLAQETERRRIARELHDDLNQDLALLAVHLDLLGQGPPGSGVEFAGRMKEMADRVKRLSSAVHDLSTELHPSKLEQLGIEAAIRGLCKELARAHGLTIEFAALPVPTTIPDDTALCLYRIAQEALRNVVKHSGARRVRVELSGDERDVSLRIADEGSGFDSGTLRGKGGLGLVSMRERLLLIGGSITIDSRPSVGTRIDVHVPLPAGDDVPKSPPDESTGSQSSQVS